MINKLKSIGKKNRLHMFGLLCHRMVYICGTRGRDIK